MSDLRALIFDVDGTLADTERDGHRIAFNNAFSEFGLDWNWSVELYGELLQIGGGKERIQYYIENYLENQNSKLSSVSLIPELHQTKNKIYKKMLVEGRIPLRPGVKRLLNEARSQDIRLAIATTTSMENVYALLEQMLHKDSVSWFDVIGAGDVVPAKKPAPDIYNYVLSMMGLGADSCIAFEDSRHGLAASVGAGLDTIVAVNAYTQNQQFDDAVLIVNHFGEPDMPFTVSKGNAGDATFLDMSLIRKLHQND